MGPRVVVVTGEIMSKVAEAYKDWDSMVVRLIQITPTAPLGLAGALPRLEKYL
jgi:NDP-sugar pyrophosphorylase family protein